LFVLLSFFEEGKMNESSHLASKTRASHGTFLAESVPCSHHDSSELQQQHPGTSTFHELNGAKAGAGSDEEREYTFPGQVKTALSTLWQIKVLLAVVPLVFVSSSDGVLFACSFLGLIPLAALLGDFTEDICKRSNEVVGALINVTFGNATELIISFVALRAGMFDLIKFSLIGSVLGNMLLVLGTGLFLGGLKRKVLSFSVQASNTYIPLLMLSVMSFLIPSGYGIAVAHGAVDKKTGGLATAAPLDGASDSVLIVSRHIAVVTAIIYLCYLWFQLVTHKDMFDEKCCSRTCSADDVDGLLEDDDEDETPDFTLGFALGGLAVASIFISYLSEVLVGSVEGFAREYNVPSQFIGLILVPIVGNAAEHATAVIMAQRGRLDVAVGVALGSSIQIALFVMPVLVLGGWVFGLGLDMNFHPYPTALLMVCVLVVSQVIGDGKSNWLEGVMLVGAYIMVGLTVLNGEILG
jgi:Ca2+:H+ antiporter